MNIREEIEQNAEVEFQNIEFQTVKRDVDDKLGCSVEMLTGTNGLKKTLD